MRRRTFVSALGAAAVGGRLTTGVSTALDLADPLQFDSTCALVASGGGKLTDSSVIAVWAEPNATNTDNADPPQTAYGETDIPLVAVETVGDGRVVGLGAPLVDSNDDFSYSQDEFLLNVYETELADGARIVHDESHGQYYTLTANDGDDFQTFAGLARDAGFTYQKTADLSSELTGSDTPDAVVVTTPGSGFSDTETSELVTFVQNGGTVLLHSQSDFNGFDNTAAMNDLASALGVSFRFDDGQVTDDQNNSGAPYRPTTANVNVSEFGAYFESRGGDGGGSGIDPTQTYTVDVASVSDGDTLTADFVNQDRTEEVRILGVDTPEVAAAADAERPAEWEGLGDRVGLQRLQFGSSTALVDGSGDPLTDDTVAVTAESSATITDGDGNGDATTYPDGTPIPLVSVLDTDGGDDPNVAALGGMLVNDGAVDAVAGLDNEEFVLNLWDRMFGEGATVRWDEGHDQFYGLSKFSQFETYAESNGYTVTAGTAVPADTSSVDGFVVTSPSASFTDDELSDLSSFVSDGGAVVFHSQSDFGDNDETANLNELLGSLETGVRFVDGQLEDPDNNTGEPFRPTTTRIDPAFDLFRERPGLDDEFSRPSDAFEEIRFADALPITDANGDPLTDDSLVPVRAEDAAELTDNDDEGSLPAYDTTNVPLVVVDDGNGAVGFANDNVTDEDLGFAGDKENEEFFLNLLDDLVSEGGTIRWDESHGQSGLSAHSVLQRYAGRNGYTLQSGDAIPTTTDEADVFVVVNPTAFSSDELSSLSTYADDGGLVFLMGVADYQNADETGNLNEIASELGAQFRFADGQVQDPDNNTGQPFRPTTTNFNTTDFSLFTQRPGTDETTAYNAYPYLSYWAAEASSFAKSALEGETVELAFDDNGVQFNGGVRDPFDRVLAYVSYDADGSGSRDTDYSKQLLANGYARSYGSSLTRLEEYLGAELAARESGAGVWSQSNPSLSPEIRDSGYTEVYVPDAAAVTTDAGDPADGRVIVAATSDGSPASAPLVAVDETANAAAVGGLLVDEGYEEAEGSGVDVSGYGNYPLVASLADELAADGRTGPILIEGGHGQFNADAGLSSEDTAYFGRYLEGQDVGFEGINDLTVDRLSDARAVLLSAPLAEYTAAELSALSSFVDGGGAVVVFGAASASDTATDRLNAVLDELGSDLAVTNNPVTDADGIEPDGADRAPVTDALGGDLDALGPFTPEETDDGGDGGGDTPSVSVVFPDGGATGGGTVTAAVELDTAPDGLAGYELTVSVGDGGVAEIADARYPVLDLTQTPEIGDGATTVTLEATDTEADAEPGATGVRLAEVDLDPQGDGQTDLTVAVTAMDDDSGGRIEPQTVAGTLTVSLDGPGAVGDSNQAARDPDDDGTYEDVDGDGDVDEADAELLFEEKDSETVEGNADAFDFNDNDRVDYDDIVELYEEATEGSGN